MRSLPILIVILLATGCGELASPSDPLGGPDPIDPTATFTRVQAEVFTPTCATLGCHHPIGQQSQLVLTPDVAYAQSVNRAAVQNPSLLRVSPNDPANSYLYRKLTGAGITGDRMPQGMPPLDETKLKLVRDWIRRGAPND